MTFDLFATVASGLEGVLLQELRGLGAEGLRPGQSGVSFRGDAALAMRVCLWSRVAGRVLMPIARIAAADAGQLYAAVSELPWEDHLAPDGTLAVDFSGGNARIRNTVFGAQRVKDGVVDRFLARGRVRPSVSMERPDLRIHVRLREDRARVSLDLSGSGLHRRGWRLAPTGAQMRETLAAGILYLCDWPEVAGAGGGLVDLMCGSGTFSIEAAWMAADVAPGLRRDHFGFLKMPAFPEKTWQRLLEEAQERQRTGLSILPPILARDVDAAALNAARKNATAAGLRERIRFERCSLEAPVTRTEYPGLTDHGLVLANPPYGIRQGEEEELLPLYRTLGQRLRTDFQGWRAAVFSARSGFRTTLAIPPDREHDLHNGPLACKLWLFDTVGGRAAPPAAEKSPIANRLKKNFKRLSKWAKREGIDCYRLYDADMPEYSAAVDLYDQWVHVQEYQAPKTVAPDKARARFEELLAAVTEVLALPAEHLFIKVRRAQKGGAQYEKQGEGEAFLTVTEGGLKFLIDLRSHLDSGLFLDHRLLRMHIGRLAAGGRFLNLFGYTGSATVYAAAGGATETVTVDLSRTYLARAERNLLLNGFSTSRNRLVRADCLEWMRRERGRYDLIFMAPPTFSNSKRMRAELDLVRDHATLIRDALRLLAPGGTLLFSVHARRFRLDSAAVPADMRCKEITRDTLPHDFQRRPTFHRTWELARSD